MDMEEKIEALIESTYQGMVSQAYQVSVNDMSVGVVAKGTYNTFDNWSAESGSGASATSSAMQRHNIIINSTFAPS